MVCCFSALFAFLSLIFVCFGSYLSNFNADQLRIDEHIGKSDPVAEGVTLVRNHFVRNNNLHRREWDPLMKNVSSCSDHKQAFGVLISALNDPYAKHIDTQQMTQRRNALFSRSVGVGFAVRRSLRAPQIRLRHVLRASLLSASAGCSALLLSKGVPYQIRRPVFYGIAGMTAAVAAWMAYPVLCPLKVVAEEGPGCDGSVPEGLAIGDTLLSINGQDVRWMPVPAVNSVLNEGSLGDQVRVKVKPSRQAQAQTPAAVAPALLHPPPPTLLARLLSALPKPDKRYCDCIQSTQAVNVPAPAPAAAPVAATGVLPKRWFQSAPSKRVERILTREYVRAPSSTAHYLLPPQCGTGVGCIRIHEFNDESYSDFCASLECLKQQLLNERRTPLQALVLDLQGNPGGSLVSALDIAALFLPRGAILTRLVSDRRSETPRSTNRRPDLTTALLLMTDLRTASASEILVEALCDNVRAQSAGARTLGKNFAQAIVTLSDGSGLCFSIREFLTPRGRSMSRGHQPGIAVPGGLLRAEDVRFDGEAKSWSVPHERVEVL